MIILMINMLESFRSAIVVSDLDITEIFTTIWIIFNNIYIYTTEKLKMINY